MLSLISAGGRDLDQPDLALAPVALRLDPEAGPRSVCAPCPGSWSKRGRAASGRSRADCCRGTRDLQRAGLASGRQIHSPLPVASAARRNRAPRAGSRRAPGAFLPERNMLVSGAMPSSRHAWRGNRRASTSTVVRAPGRHHEGDRRRLAPGDRAARRRHVLSRGRRLAPARIAETGNSSRRGRGRVDRQPAGRGAIGLAAADRRGNSSRRGTRRPRRMSGRLSGWVTLKPASASSLRRLLEARVGEVELVR